MFISKAVIIGLSVCIVALVFALLERPVAQQIDSAILGDGHEPRARIVGNAIPLPLLERG